MTEKMEANDLRLERFRQLTNQKLESIAQHKSAIRELEQQIAEMRFIWGEDLVEDADAERRRIKAEKKAEDRQKTRELRELSLARLAQENEINGKMKPPQPINHRARNSTIPNWSPEEDQKILDYVTAKGPLHLSAVAAALLPKLKGRTAGAIVQRIRKIDGLNLHKEDKPNGGVAHLLVEAA